MNKLKKIYYLAYYILFYHKKILQILTQKNAKRISVKEVERKYPKVSIVIITYNALDYIKKCLMSLQDTDYSNLEIIVVDNNSDKEVKKYLSVALSNKQITKLYLSKKNTYFSGGNNIGVGLSDFKSKYVLLLNSDTEIKNSSWLKLLIQNAPDEGIISLGKVDFPVIRPDGWCFMINRNLYLKFGGINEYFKMNWGLSELTSKVINNYPVRSIINPEEYVYHFGQKSRSSKKGNNNFNKLSFIQILNLFNNKFTELYKV